MGGSTHEGEEQTLLDAFRTLQEVAPKARLVLAPRHPERLGKVRELLDREGFPFSARSAPQAPAAASVLLVDTMGELSTLYAMADVTFVGGTLAPIGGHNLLEPAAFGLPILVGPHLETIRETATSLERAGTLKVVGTADELAGRVLEFWRERSKVKAAAAGARAVIEQHQGSVGRTLKILNRALRP